MPFESIISEKDSRTREKTRGETLWLARVCVSAKIKLFLTLSSGQRGMLSERASERPRSSKRSAEEVDSCQVLTAPMLILTYLMMFNAVQTNVTIPSLSYHNQHYNCYCYCYSSEQVISSHFLLVIRRGNMSGMNLCFVDFLLI